MTKIFVTVENTFQIKILLPKSTKDKIINIFSGLISPETVYLSTFKWQNQTSNGVTHMKQHKKIKQETYIRHLTILANNIFGCNVN